MSTEAPEAATMPTAHADALGQLPRLALQEFLKEGSSGHGSIGSPITYVIYEPRTFLLARWPCGIAISGGS